MSYPNHCTNKVTIYTGTWFQNAHEVPCGKTVAGVVQMCNECVAKYNKIYPQGWSYYPGDTCKHGVYVGGCGVDYMCPQCENGEDVDEDGLVANYGIEPEDVEDNADPTEFDLSCDGG